MHTHNKSMLEQMYDGEYFPLEAIMPSDPRYFTMHQRLTAEKDYIATRLEPGEREHLDHLMELVTTTNGIEAYANYAYGFRSGALLMHELLTAKEKPSKNECN